MNVKNCLAQNDNTHTDTPKMRIDKKKLSYVYGSYTVTRHTCTNHFPDWDHKNFRITQTKQGKKHLYVK